MSFSIRARVSCRFVVSVKAKAVVAVIWKWLRTTLNESTSSRNSDATITVFGQGPHRSPGSNCTSILFFSAQIRSKKANHNAKVSTYLDVCWFNLWTLSLFCACFAQAVSLNFFFHHFWAPVGLVPRQRFAPIFHQKCFRHSKGRMCWRTNERRSSVSHGDKLIHGHTSIVKEPDSPKTESKSQSNPCQASKEVHRKFVTRWSTVITFTFHHLVRFLKL